MDPNTYYEPATRRRFGAREAVKGAAALLPFMRYVPRNPAFLIGAAALGVGALAWRNRQRIRERATPLIQDASARGVALRDRVRSRRDPSGAIDI